MRNDRYGRSAWHAHSFILAWVLVGWGTVCSAQGIGHASEAPSAILSDSDAVGNGGSHAASRAEALDVRVTGNQVSVDLEDALLADVLALLARDSGVVARISEQMSQHRLNDRFSGLTVEQALRRLLSNTNYALVHDRGVEDGPIIEVFVLAPGEASSSGAPSPARLSDVDPHTMLEALEPGSLPDNVRAALLAAAAHEDQIQVPEQDLPALRAEALTTLLERMESADGETEATRLLRERIRQLPDP